MSLYTRPLSRIARTRPCLAQWRRTAARCYASAPATGGDDGWFPALRREMLDRPVVFYRERVNTDTDRKLIDTLRPFLPPEWCRHLRSEHSRVPMGHTLLWFNTSMPVDQLLPDGTDPLQSPGEPWVRRMWAGGRMQTRAGEYYSKRRGLVADSDMLCAERIQDVQLKGSADAAKIFVTLERYFTRWDTLQTRLALLSSTLGPPELFRRQLQDDGWGDAVLKEERNLVFLKEKTSAEVESMRAGQLAPTRYLEAPRGEPDFAHTLTPTRALLFRYSALTLNAHLIHLDREYARNVEGHRNLLVHGPLALTLLLQAVSGHVRVKSERKHAVESIEYRNLAPLYCDEPMRLCGRVKKTFGDGELYDVWIQGPTGGVAVKGTVRAIELVHTKEPTLASAPKPLTPKSPHELRISKISTDAGERVSANSKTRLKGSRRVDILGSVENQTATPALETGQSPDTADNTSASVRRPIRSVASAAPNSQPRAGDQQKTRSRDTHAVDPTRLRLSTFAVPPASSPSKAPPSEARPSEAQPSAMSRAKPSHIRELQNRVPHAVQARIIAADDSIVRKYAGTPYVSNPTDIANRHSRYQRSGILKVSQHSIRYTVKPEAHRGKPRLSAWQRV